MKESLMITRTLLALSLCLAAGACGSAPTPDTSEPTGHNKSDDADKAFKIRQAEIDLEKARLEKTRADLQAQRAYEDAKRDLTLAKDALDHDLEVATPLELRNARLGLQRQEDYMTDATMELEQLTSMYKDQDISALTSELVITRAKRDLERAKETLEITRKNFDVLKTVTIPKRHESLKHEVVLKIRAHEAAKAALELNALTQEKALANAQKALDDLKKDTPAKK